MSASYCYWFPWIVRVPNSITKTSHCSAIWNSFIILILASSDTNTQQACSVLNCIELLFENILWVYRKFVLIERQLNAYSFRNNYALYLLQRCSSAVLSHCFSKQNENLNLIYRTKCSFKKVIVKITLLFFSTNKIKKFNEWEEFIRTHFEDIFNGFWPDNHRPLA